jgi:hypothetical protein
VRDWVPDPQVSEQEPNEPQDPTWQSTGQGEVLHVWISLSAGQDAPPFEGEILIRRVRDWVPDPQVSEQESNEPQDPTWQSTGQGEVLHAWISLSAGHKAPPFEAGVAMVRKRIWDPEPHDLVQVLKAAHSLTTQATGQADVVQEEVSDNVVEQGWPPFCSKLVTVRVREWVPVPPQVTEQSEKSLQLERTQSIGHAVGLQLEKTCSTKGAHAAPPSDEGVMTSRVREKNPPPQLTEQTVPKLVHCPTTQSTGQPKVLHARVETKTWSTAQFPADVIAKVVRLRDWVPPAQLALQSDHVVQVVSMLEHASSPQAMNLATWRAEPSGISSKEGIKNEFVDAGDEAMDSTDAAVMSGVIPMTKIREKARRFAAARAVGPNPSEDSPSVATNTTVLFELPLQPAEGWRRLFSTWVKPVAVAVAPAT